MDDKSVGYLEPNMLDSKNEANHKASDCPDSSDKTKESVKVKTKRSSAEGPDELNISI